MSAFHNRTELSTPPVASRCPSGLNATLMTALVWPVRGAPRLSLEAKRFRHRAIATHQIPVGNIVVAGYGQIDRLLLQRNDNWRRPPRTTPDCLPTGQGEHARAQTRD